MIARGLEARGVVVHVDGRALFEPLDVAIPRGRLVALRGPSGSGKTSLLRVLAGLADPAGGEVTLDGKAPGQVGWPLWRRRACLVTQRPVLLDGPLRASLARPFSYATATGPFPAARAEELLRRLGLEPSTLERAAASLSEGEKQRAALVRALLIEPPVLLLDEPTSALDPESTRRVEELLREGAREGRWGALIVTHSLEQAERWCDEKLELTQARGGQGA